MLTPVSYAQAGFFSDVIDFFESDSLFESIKKLFTSKKEVTPKQEEKEEQESDKETLLEQEQEKTILDTELKEKQELNNDKDAISPSDTTNNPQLDTLENTSSSEFILTPTTGGIITSFDSGIDDTSTEQESTITKQENIITEQESTITSNKELITDIVLQEEVITNKQVSSTTDIIIQELQNKVQQIKEQQVKDVQDINTKLDQIIDNISTTKGDLTEQIEKVKIRKDQARTLSSTQTRPLVEQREIITYNPPTINQKLLKNVNVNIPSLGNILKYNGSEWVNNSLSEAGISVLNHRHTESDIDNLTHTTKASLGLDISDSPIFSGVTANSFNGSTITLNNAGALQTTTMAGNTFSFRAYNTDTLEYNNLATLTAGAVPTLNLADTVTLGGDTITTINNAQTLNNKIINTDDNVITIKASDIIDITATDAELNLLDLATLTAGNVLRATDASTAEWQQLAISDINFIAGENLTLSDNTLNIDDGFLLNTGDTATGIYDFGETAFEVPNSYELPETCTTGDIYLDTNGISGRKLYACEEADTWVLQGDGGGGMNNILEDTTPQLGGDLDINGKDITSETGLNISIGSLAGNDFTIGTNKFTVKGDTGNIGIGTVGPYKKLDILDTSNSQLRLTQSNGTKYSDFQVNAVGDLTITPIGNDTTLDSNLWVCDGACPPSSPGVSGNLIIEGDIKYPTVGSVKRSMILTPANSISSVNGSAAKTQIDGVNHSYNVLDFDAIDDEATYWHFIMPDSYDNEAIDITYYWESSAIEGDVVWCFQANGLSANLNEDIDSALPIANCEVDTAQENANNLASITESVADSNFAKGEYTIFKVFRDADNIADTMINDARLLRIKIEYGVSQESD